MKRTRLIAIAGLLALTPLAARAELSVFACEPEWAALAERIGGEQVRSWSATTAAGARPQADSRRSNTAAGYPGRVRM